MKAGADQDLSNSSSGPPLFLEGQGHLVMPVSAQMSLLQGGGPLPFHVLLVSFFIPLITCFLCFNVFALTCLYSFKADL